MKLPPISRYLWNGIFQNTREARAHVWHASVRQRNRAVQVEVGKVHGIGTGILITACITHVECRTVEGYTGYNDCIYSADVVCGVHCPA